MRVVTIKDAQILIPNKEHKNFTSNGAIIPQGIELEGENREIKGLRRGEPFTYRLFITNNKQIIYSNNIKPMDNTEVTLGADASQSPTTVNFIPAEAFNKLKTTGLIMGAVAGFAWSKYKKQDNKRILITTIIGAAIGYGAAYMIDSKRAATVKASK